MLEWLEHEEYNRKAKLYELINKEVMDTHIKEMLNEILNEYDDVISKELYNIRNCK